jgi:hypothetical protein
MDQLSFKSIYHLSILMEVKQIDFEESEFQVLLTLEEF